MAAGNQRPVEFNLHFSEWNRAGGRPNNLAIHAQRLTTILLHRIPIHLSTPVNNLIIEEHIIGVMNNGVDPLLGYTNF